MRKMYTEELPRSRGKLVGFKLVGLKVKFIYDDVEGEVEIANYDNGYLYIRFINTYVLRVTIDNFEKCSIEELISKNKYAIEKSMNKLNNSLVQVKNRFDYLYAVGEILKDNKRDLIITDKKKDNGERWYKIKCNKCGFESGKHYVPRIKEHKDEYWIRESSLKQGSGCACCTGRVLSEGHNDIPTTDPWMIDCFQGGYDEAKLYTRTSSKKINPKCPFCGKIKEKSMPIRAIFRIHSTGCSCGDGFKYTEKLLSAVLNELNIDFYPQLNKTTLSWCDKYRYDFYIPSLNIIIETHGLQHYEDASGVFIKTLKETQENDRIKQELALTNEIKEENYIVIDCRYSKLEFIKNNILNSRLHELFDLSTIDWIKVGEFATKNIVKECCDLYETGIHNMKDLAKIMKITHYTVRNYLIKGAELGWCNYETKTRVKK